MPLSQLNNDNKVLIDYTLTTWSEKKTKYGEALFGNGCALKLQSILLLEDKYNSREKRGRMR